MRGAIVEFLQATVLVYTAHAIHLYSYLLLSAKIHCGIKRNQVFSSHYYFSELNELSFELLATKSADFHSSGTIITAWNSAYRGPEITRFGPVFFENTDKSGGIVLHDTRRVRRVSDIVFFPIRTFSVARKIRPSGTPLKRRVSGPVISHILPDLPSITAWAAHVTVFKLSSHFSFLENNYLL